MNVLDNILQFKIDEVRAREKINPISKIRESQRLFNIRNFKNALINKRVDIIAEIKLKSPSEGQISKNDDIQDIAKSYELNRASAISVLTDNHFFGGKLDFIKQVKSAVDIPILQKDFIITEYQVWESFYIGADAILLIADAIEGLLLNDLHALASDLGLHVLVEMHNDKYIETVLKLNPEIIGVNCRNLKMMNTNFMIFRDFINYLPEDVIKVAESGIKTNKDLRKLFAIGYDAALIGTNLMKNDDPGSALKNLLI